MPAFYSRWFMERIRRGYCTVVNPFNAKQRRRVSLRPEDVDVIAFWTKDPRPLIPHLPELDARGYKYYFQFTLNGYGETLEPHAPALEAALAAFRKLAGAIGPERVIWRYDPIVLSNVTDEAYHISRFAGIAGQLEGSTTRMVVSLLDDYRQTVSRLKSLTQQGMEVRYGIGKAELAHLLRELAGIAWGHGLELRTCAESPELVHCGVLPGRCIDPDYLQQVFGLELGLPKDRSQRPECGCVQSQDIGAYRTCRHGCLYCYAGSLNAGLRNRVRHNLGSPSLLETDSASES